jgi:hypothetical protein
MYVVCAQQLFVLMLKEMTKEAAGMQALIRWRGLWMERGGAGEMEADSSHRGSRRWVDKTGRQIERSQPPP